MESTRERRFYLREYRAISRAISIYEDLPILIKHFVEGLCRAFKVKGASIMLYDEREEQLFHVASYGISEEYLTKGPVFIDSNDDAFAKGKVVFVEDLQSDDRVQYPQAAISEGIVSMLSIPIKCRQHTLGQIRIYHSTPFVLHEDDQDSILVLALQLGIAIENNGLKNFLERVKESMGSLPLRMLEGIQHY